MRHSKNAKPQVSCFWELCRLQKLDLTGLCETALTRSTMHFQQALLDLKQSHEARNLLMADLKQMHQHNVDAAAVRLQTQLDEQVM